MEHIKQLLRDYGYPEEEIPNVLKELGTTDYEQIEKSIMPYRDITANRDNQDRF
ncbi:hypothetical protein V7068_21700 [Bacillus sp. JJ634]